jgi:hypothetical protein
MTEKATSIQLVLTNVRLSYLYAFKPYQGKNDDGSISSSYTAHGILEPTDAQVRAIKDAINKVATAAWGDKAGQVLQQLKAQDKLCLHDGMTKSDAAYQGKMFISANSKKQPRIVAPDRTEITTNPGHKHAPYSGCWGTLIVDIYAQSPDGRPSKWGKRVNAGFMGVQLTKHDTAFGGGKVAKIEEFGVVALDGDAAIPETADVGAEADGLL